MAPTLLAPLVQMRQATTSTSRAVTGIFLMLFIVFILPELSILGIFYRNLPTKDR